MFSPTGDQFLHQYHCPPPPPPPPLMTTMEKSWKPTVELAPNCPRCASPNTKFCYYNNYSLSQPRYFCKGCRRYWTKGGSLRNVPVGGGCRKNRRGKPVRLPHHRERPSSTSSNSQDSGGERSESSNGDSSSAAQHIDMAVVFAKFLNQKPESGGRDDDLLELDTETVRVEEDVIVPDDPEDQGIEQVVLGNDVREFGLDSLLGGDHHHDEAVLEQDVFWSDIHDETANFSWQLQELEAFPVSNDIDDQLRFSTDSMNDNWSSLDLYSGFEVFSRS